jgi:ABC-type lipoprotein release transport system permease subunit
MTLTAAGLLISALAVFTGAALFLALIALAASGLPALRASRLDPGEPLRRA